MTSFDFEQVLRIVAEEHRRQGQEDIAVLFDAGALREACRKYYAQPEKPKSFEEWLQMRGDAIVT